MENVKVDFNRGLRRSKRMSETVQTRKPEPPTLRTPVPGAHAAALMRVSARFLLLIVLVFGPAMSHGEGPPQVVARVNSVPITLNDVDTEITVIISRTLYHKDSSPEKREALRKEAIENLIEKELEYEEAKRQGITVDGAKVKERLREVKKSFPSEKEFNEALSRNNMTVRKYEERIERGFILEEIFRAEVEEKAKVGDEEIREYYEKNRNNYRELEKIKLRHIVIMFEPSKGSEDKDRAKKKAEEILARAKAGEDFGALAYETSEDVYKVKGGELGYVHRGRMDPELEKTAFALKVGEIMGPIETEYGYYIIKIEDRKPEKQYSFDEVKGEIRNMLEKKAKEERKTAWIKSLKEKAKIEYQ